MGVFCLADEVDDFDDLGSGVAEGEETLVGLGEESGGETDIDGGLDESADGVLVEVADVDLVEAEEDDGILDIVDIGDGGADCVLMSNSRLVFVIDIHCVLLNFFRIGLRNESINACRKIRCSFSYILLLYHRILS